MIHRSISNIVKNSPHLKWLEDSTIYICRHGSKAYGTNISTSDDDFKGIAIPPKEYFFGNLNNFEQAITLAPLDDVVIFDIRKFFLLSSQANPNLIEVLFCDSQDHIFVSDLGQLLLDNKDIFLSKKVKYTFLGYAVSQLKKLKLHKSFIDKEIKSLPERKDFGLPEKYEIPKDQLQAISAEIQKELDKQNFDFMDDLDETVKQEIRSNVQNVLIDLKIGTNDKWISCAKTIGLDSNIIEILKKEREYSSKVKEFHSYNEWKKNRNPARFADEEKFGYDCYSDDTEFLTDNGFKKFDDVLTTDKLATVFIKRGFELHAMKHRPPLFGVEYQYQVDKFDSMYNGPMYHFTGSHTDCLVTSNHRMLLQKEERISRVKSEWILEEANFVPDTFNILVAPEPRVKNYSNKDLFKNLNISIENYLSLMGWYLSDGTARFDKNKKIKAISISQKPGGKLSWHMSRFHNSCKLSAKTHLYEYEKKPNIFNKKIHREQTLVIGKDIATHIVEECSFKENKRIPRYAFGLSKRLIEILLINLIRGDGARREHKSKSESFIFYSKSKLLADDVQELAIMAGWETALWGPYKIISNNYETEMYQVHLRKIQDRTKTLIRSKNIKKIDVKNQRVVCFSVPNGTLITRRNGKVSIHGNCKHAYHLVRLIKMAEEILTTGKVIVKRPDREELLSIRNGAWSYEKLISFAEEKQKSLDIAYNSYNVLPKAPNFKKIDELLIQMIEKSLAK